MRQYMYHQESHFADLEEMKNDCTHVFLDEKNADVGGIPVISDGREVWLNGTESHSLIVSSTGSGKSRRVIYPLMLSLINAGSNIICLDPKGEIAKGTIPFMEDRYNYKILNFREPDKSTHYNPLYHAACEYFKGNKDLAIEEAHIVAETLYNSEVRDEKDPYWTVSSANLMCGLFLVCCEIVDSAEQVTLELIYRLYVDGFNDDQALLKYVKMEASDLVESALYSIVTAPKDTLHSILAVFGSVLQRLVINEKVNEMLSGTSIDIADFEKEKPLCFFIVSRDETSTYDTIYSCILSQLYRNLCSRAEELGGSLDRRCEFVLDEFGSLKLTDCVSTLSSARSRNIRYHIVVQSFSQLKTKYSEDEAHSIMQNCLCQLCLFSADTVMQKIFSDRAGNYFSQYGDTQKERHLIAPSQLQHFEEGRGLLLMNRSFPFIVNLPDRSTYESRLHIEPLKHLPNMKEVKFKKFDIFLPKYVDDLSKKKIAEQIKESLREGKRVNIDDLEDGKMKKKHSIVDMVDEIDKSIFD